MYPREEEIIGWAIKKGIVEADDKLKQGLKTVEEIAELVKHSIKGEDIRDDIGDIYVTIVVQAHMNGLNMKKCHKNPYEMETREETKFALVDLVLAVGMLLDSIEREDSVDIWISNIYNGLINICDMENLSLPCCIEIAYNEIKGRTGKMVNGIFIKDKK